MADYRMTISLNVLEHLGLNLYSSVPAVLSEVVANSWDADARRVDVWTNQAGGSVIVKDNGHGMTRNDVNDRFLKVGFRRRSIGQNANTAELNRKVMGRKGIGKLSLFSVANRIDVYTVKDGQKSAFRLEVEEIRERVRIEEERAEAARQAGRDHRSVAYEPATLDFATCPRDLGDRGTLLVISDFKKDIARTSSFLRTRLARRFSVIGAANKFHLFVDDQEVTVADREYHSKVQYLWTYGQAGAEFAAGIDEFAAVNDDAGNPQDRRNVVTFRFPKTAYRGDDAKLHPADPETIRDKGGNPLVPVDSETAWNDGGEIAFRRHVEGWIATVEEVDQLKDSDGEGNLNRIVLVVRGKVAQENVLESLGFGGVFSKYLFGEVHVDFLDETELDDAATSSRQSIKEDDPRFRALTKWLRGEVNNVQNHWTRRRREARVSQALELPVVSKWFNTLSNEHEKRAARQLLDKVAAVTLHDEKNKANIYQFAIVGFERIRLHQDLARLKDLPKGRLGDFEEIFGRLDNYEGALYQVIVEERLAAIDVLSKKVHENDLEKVIQEHLAKHMWLLDPAWERATTATLHVEETIKQSFQALDAKYPKETANRIDIRYQKVGGEHVIVELKRPDVRLSEGELQDQVLRYRGELQRCLRSLNAPDQTIECVILIGTLPREWEENPPAMREGIEAMRVRHIRVHTYHALLDEAQKRYKAFYDGRADAGELSNILQQVVVDLQEQIAENTIEVARAIVPSQ